MRIQFVLVVCLLAWMGFSFAQNTTALIPFKPIELPQTIKPNPIPVGMTDLPSNYLVMSEKGTDCLPVVDNLQVPTGVGGTPDSTVTAQIQKIKDADQAARQNLTANSDWQKISREDAERRTQLLELIPKASTADGFANIALVFQHGNCVQHYLLAHYFAGLGMKTNPMARWLVAATLDRALMSIGRAQKYGTQYVPKNEKCIALYLVDPRTTDAERMQLGVPILEAAINQAKNFSAPDCP